MRSVAFFCTIFITLAFVGRGMRDHPLPWHTAWLLPFGETGWELAFQLSVRDGWSADKVREVMGDPAWKIVGGQIISPGDPGFPDTAPDEIWAYPSPRSRSSGPAPVFRNGILLRH